MFGGDIFELRQFNRLISQKPLKELLTYLTKKRKIDKLSEYLTCESDDIHNLNDLKALNYEDQLFYIYQRNMRENLSMVMMVSEPIKYVRGILTFIVQQFIEAGYDRFPILSCDNNTVVEANMALVCTCIGFGYALIKDQSKEVFEEARNFLGSYSDDFFKTLGVIKKILDDKYDREIATKLQCYLRDNDFLDDAVSEPNP